MSNIGDILARSKALQKKYDKYMEQPKPQRKAAEFKGDAFDREIAMLDDNVEETAVEAAGIPTIKDRTLVAQKNADIRKRKQMLLADVDELRKIAKKGKVGKETVMARQDRIAAIEERIIKIPDGLNAARKKPGAQPGKGRFGAGPSKQSDVRIDMGDIEMSDMHSGRDGYYAETEENAAFRSEWERRKVKQDDDLGIIEQGLGNLQNIAQDMGSEINKQDVLLDEVETQMDRATKAVETNNQKLAGVLHRVRSTRNFCIDITLIIILLALLGYIYTLIT